MIHPYGSWPRTHDFPIGSAPFVRTDSKSCTRLRSLRRPAPAALFTCTAPGVSADTFLDALLASETSLAGSTTAVTYVYFGAIRERRCLRLISALRRSQLFL